MKVKSGWKVALGALLALAAGCSRHSSSGVLIVVDPAGPAQTFDGIGAVSAGASSRLLIDYPEPQRSQILDYLFKPHYGASLQHLKVEIGADVNSTDGSEPSYARTPTDRDFTRGYEWWLMQQAKLRNPAIVLDSLAWGAPGWVGEFYSPRNAGYMAGFVAGADSALHLQFAETGVWNETPFNADYVKTLRQKLDAASPGTRIVCCDEYPGEGGGQWKILDAMRGDPVLARAVAIVSVHYPRKKEGYTTPPEAKAAQKPLWSSEDQPNSGGGPILARDWQHGGRILAKLYNENYLDGGFTATEIWSPVTSYYDILAAPNSGLMYANTPWSGNYQVQSAIWVTAHTTQFAQPGWKYLERACGHLPSKGSYVTLASPNGKDWSTVLETIDASSPQTVSFEISGALSRDTVHIWETNASRTFEHVADIPVKGGHFSYTFEAGSLYSLTTTTGQFKGTSTPPDPRPFPLPWSENFEQVTLRHSPKFLSDQDGAFEVDKCVGRRGRCLEQVITQKPIPWGPLPDPWTLAGDIGWTDYRVTADVHLQGRGTAMLLGRIDSADVFADQKAKLPSGYVLRLDSTGRWSLLSSAYKQPTLLLAHGTLDRAPAAWLHLALAFHGTQISAYLNNKLLASATDSSHAHGMFGIGTSWDRVQFDNVGVSRFPSPVRGE
ncbi:galactosylceramidase [Acidipila rosea]|nr:galactosylceramidase [Acidipila rosea]